MPEGLFGMVMGYSLMPDNGGQEPSCVAASRRAAAGAHCAGDLDKALSLTALLGPPHSAVANVFLIPTLQLKKLRLREV